MKLTSRIALGLAISGLAGQAAFAATTYTNTIAQMTAYITNQMAIGNVQGLSIVLVDDQAVVWSQGFGMADREGGVAADADTVYHTQNSLPGGAENKNKCTPINATLFLN